ncbi:MAG: methionyl-tRNA formyltransferase [Burkholderiales bacterium]|nr:methionyl-tRNA formyltransferase [Burkholderiales bacterium]MDP2399968.1 methionyl-tRNA formyltransferase [Burkholderiales bacterium]
MNLIFAGTPVFAAVALEALLDAGHQVSLVLTQPDRPAGRGLKSQSSAVKQLALVRQLEIAQPPTLRDETFIGQLQRLGADVMVVAAYGLMIPSSLLVMPQLGCLNIHASLLPRWRGAAPIQRAILAGDCETGVTIMQMDEGLDTGATLLTTTVAIDGDDTAGTLHDKLARVGAELIVRALRELPLVPVLQNSVGATYAAKLSKAEAAIDWSKTAVEINRQIRAFNPAPGAFTLLAGQPVKIWRAEPAGACFAGAAPGTVVQIEAGVPRVAAGNGSLRLLELQRAGGKRVAAQAFLAGMPLTMGCRLGA